VRYFLNIDNILDWIGKEIEDYPEMCRILEEEIEDGGNRTRQIENWRRFIDFEKLKYKHKYFIKGIIAPPLPPKKDGRGEGNSEKYIGLIELILTYILLGQENFTLTSTPNRLYTQFGMSNSNFGINRHKHSITDDTIKSFDVNHFHQRVSQKLDKILNDALKNLKRRNIIDYEKKIAIVFGEDTIIADDNKVQQILAVENLVLAEMGLKSKIEVFLKFKNEKYYSRVCKLLFDKYEWDSYHTLYKMKLNKGNVIDRISNEIFRDGRKCLNEVVVEAINQQAVNYYDKNTKAYDEYCANQIGVIRKKRGRYPNFFRYNEDYIDIQKRLVEHFIQIQKH
jgi:hypothetical protein